MKRNRFKEAIVKTQVRRRGAPTILLVGLLGAVVGWVPLASAADDASTARIIDYYRRKANLPPEIKATVVNVTDSQIPGAKSATLELSRDRADANSRRAHVAGWSLRRLRRSGGRHV